MWNALPQLTNKCLSFDNGIINYYIYKALIPVILLMLVQAANKMLLASILIINAWLLIDAVRFSLVAITNMQTCNYSINFATIAIMLLVNVLLKLSKCLLLFGGNMLLVTCIIIQLNKCINTKSAVLKAINVRSNNCFIFKCCAKLHTWEIR